MTLFFVIFSAILAAIGNLMMRKNLDYRGTPNAFLSYFFLFSLLFSLLPLNGQNIFNPFSPRMFLTGAIIGSLGFLMMTLTNRCLQIGPSGLTFAFQNAGSILPAILLFLFLGPSFGFHFTAFLMIGMLLLLIGLYLSARSEASSNYPLKPWLLTALAVFFSQGLTQTLLHWRSLLLTEQSASSKLIPWTCSSHEEFWFLPGFFLTPAILQWIKFYLLEKRAGSYKEIGFGFLAGGLNFCSTTLLLFATKTAPTPTQRAIIFPLFAVSVILGCDIWGKFLYKEKVCWTGLLLCLLGVFIGTL